MTLQVFQAVTLNTSTYQPHALLMRILPAEGPSILREYFRPRAHNKSHRQLGLVQIRIALQEGCVSIVVIHSQINKDKGNKQLIVAWIQFPFKSVLTGLPER